MYRKKRLSGVYERPSDMVCSSLTGFLTRRDGADGVTKLGSGIRLVSAWTGIMCLES